VQNHIRRNSAFSGKKYMAGNFKFKKNTSLAVYATKPPLQIASGNQFPEAAILHKSPMNAFTSAVFLN